MAALAPGQSSSCADPVLDLYTQVSGVLTDMAAVEFQIYDRTDPLVPVQVYPTVLGNRASVSLLACPTGDKLGTGHYVARYTADLAPTLGRYEIRWFIKLTLSSGEQTYSEEFEIIPAVAAGSAINYASVTDMRNEGVDPTIYSDARVSAALNMASRTIERITRRWFYPKALELDLDGDDTSQLFLGFPIIAVSSITQLTDAIDLVNDVKIYNRHITQGLTNPDDRESPRIQFVGPSPAVRHLGGFGRARQWLKRPPQSIHIVGVFGYTDPAGSSFTQGITPPAIAQCCKLLALRELPPLGDPQERFSVQYAYRLMGETTRDQSYNLGPGRTSSNGWTGDPEIDGILAQYMAPMHMRVC